jgi:predicted aspartyl protease
MVRVREMGKVLVEVTVTNRADQILASDGTIPSCQIRSITRQDVLVDTGPTTLCLPSELIAQLGLTLLKEVDVATAQGISKARIFQDARLSLCGSY